MMVKSLVWYASYGSNLCRERFLCYIQGGIPEGSVKAETGCRDRSLPVEDSLIFIKRGLYFAGHSQRWGGSVAFIGGEEGELNKKDQTLARMYLINREQFCDVIAQENGVLFPVKIPWEQVVDQGEKDLLDSLYGRVVYLGKRDGFPVFTFTTSRKLGANISPSESYLKMLINGIKETHSFSPKQISVYLAEKPGVKGNYNQMRLLELVKECW